MSVYATTQVWRHSEQKGTHLLVMLAIADWADDAGKAYPSIRTLAKKIRSSPRNVQKIVRQLESAGEIDILPNEGPKGVNEYVLAGVSSMTGGCNSAAEPVSNGSARGVIQGRLGVSRSSPNTLSNTSEIHHSTRDCDAEFLSELQKKTAYTALDVQHQYEKAAVWCEVNNRQPTRRFFVNWLNRCDKPLAPLGGNSATVEPRPQELIRPEIAEDERIMRERLAKPNGEANPK